MEVEITEAEEAFKTFQAELMTCVAKERHAYGEHSQYDVWPLIERNFRALPVDADILQQRFGIACEKIIWNEIEEMVLTKRNEIIRLAEESSGQIISGRKVYDTLCLPYYFAKMMDNVSRDFRNVLHHAIKDFNFHSRALQLIMQDTNVRVVSLNFLMTNSVNPHSLSEPISETAVMGLYETGSDDERSDLLAALLLDGRLAYLLELRYVHGLMGKDTDKYVFKHLASNERFRDEFVRSMRSVDLAIDPRRKRFYNLVKTDITWDRRGIWVNPPRELIWLFICDSSRVKSCLQRQARSSSTEGSQDLMYSPRDLNSMRLTLRFILTSMFDITPTDCSRIVLRQTMCQWRQTNRRALRSFPSELIMRLDGMVFGPKIVQRAETE